MGITENEHKGLKVEKPKDAREEMLTIQWLWFWIWVMQNDKMEDRA
jgi:hypothetical protein